MTLISLRSLSGTNPTPPKYFCSRIAPANDAIASVAIASRWSSAQPTTPL